jgi:glycosyltransferase involved in cell wall biosynthesis
VKILVISRTSVPGGETGSWQPPSFVLEQVESLRLQDVEVEWILIRSGGLRGYSQGLIELRARLERRDIDLVHAHNGLTGVVGVAQRVCPTVVTYHGCDINRRRTNAVSSAISRLAAWNIYVSEALRQQLLIRAPVNSSVIPCGIDLDRFRPVPRRKARQELELAQGIHLVLFAGAFDNPAKCSQLAREAIARIDGVRLVELKGYDRRQVSLLMCAADLLLMTSIREGSPTVIKEALAVNTPVVSTDVGDVRAVLSKVAGCEIVPAHVEGVEKGVRAVLNDPRTIAGRGHMEELSLPSVARRLVRVYEEVIAGEPLNEPVAK